MTEWVPRRGPTLRRPAGFLLHATGVPTVRHRTLLGALKDGADRVRAGVAGVLVEDLAYGITWRAARRRRRAWMPDAATMNPPPRRR
jgi:hypothetical protein